MKNWIYYFMILACMPFMTLEAQDFTVTAPFTSPVRNTCNAGNECSLNVTPEHIYEVVIPTSGQWIFSLCGATFDTHMFLGTTPCSNDIDSNDDSCGTASEILVNIPAGTYYVAVEGFLFACGEYTLSVDEASTSYTATAPFTSPLRSTCSGANNCSLSSSREHTYEVVIPTSGQWLFSLCGADFDTHMFIGTSACSNDIDSNDDSCGTASEIFVNIPAGTYYVTVEGFGIACGAYTLTVDEASTSYTATAPFTSPLRSTCSGTNNCSLSSSSEHTYEVVIPTSGQWLFSLCGADFDTYMFLGTSPCSNDIDSNDDSCGTASELLIDIPAGTYYVTVEGFDTFDCGGYTLSVQPFNVDYTPDYIVTAPYTSPVRNTCTANNNCLLRSSPEHTYEVVVPTSGQWRFSLCGAGFDTYIMIGSTICSQDIGFDDDSCDLASELTLDIPAGTYYVMVEGFDLFECGEYTLSVELITSVDDVQLNTFKAYPNPTNGLVNIERNTSHNVSYQIQDILGKNIETGVLTASQATLDISTFINGVYFLKMEDQTVKLVKQ